MDIAKYDSMSYPTYAVDDSKLWNIQSGYNITCAVHHTCYEGGIMDWAQHYENSAFYSTLSSERYIIYTNKNMEIYQL